MNKHKMSDRQSLLNPSNRVSPNDDEDDNESNKQYSFRNLFAWFRWFSEKEDDDTGYVKKDEMISVFQMFRFANRVDILLMFISGCIMVMEAFCFISYLIRFGRITGLFAMESFTGSCSHDQENRTNILKNNLTCPLGIDLNAVNFAHLHKFCHHSEVVLLSTSTPAMPSFREKVMHIVHWLIIIGAGDFCCLSIGMIIWMISIQRQTSRMNILFFRSLIQRNISYFDTSPSSQSNAELFANIETIKNGIGLEFILWNATLFCITGSVIISLVINWQLTLIMLCLMSLVIGGSFVFGRIMINQTANELKIYFKVGQIVEEVFSSLRTVLSLNGSQFEQQRYEKALHPTHRSAVRKGAVYGIYVGWLSLITYIVYSVGFIFGSLLLSYEDQSRFNISDILVIVFVFGLCTGFLGYIGTFFQSLSEARAAAVSVFRLIDEAQDRSINEPDIWGDDDEISDTRLTSDIDGHIEFDNVNFIYPSRKEVSVLHNLSFVARTGQTTALVGSSGCGKSTCVSLLLRQYEASSGHIKINGRAITNYHLKQLRQKIGVVSQEPILFNTSIYENIRFGKVNATRAEIEEAARQSNAHSFIMRLPNKYETLVGERGIQLSGGEKQRIALARALVKQPSILLLDEATSALDNVNEKIVQETLDQVCKDRTTIVIAHRLTTIENAHHIYVLDKGSVCEEGTHKTLMATDGGKYQTMVKRQQAGTLTEDKNDLMNMKQAIEEDDEQFILKRTRSLTDGQTVDVNKENSTSSERKSIFSRLLSMSSPEWIIIFIGCIACAMSGAAQVAFAILLAKIIHAFRYCTHSESHYHVSKSSFLFFLLGLLLMFLCFVQYTAFSMAGSKLTQRIRSKTFACLLRQEIAYFDRPENSSGAISVRLSSGAATVEHMVGTRLGVICEALALSAFGLLFGIFFSWQLTMIIFFMFLVLGIITYVNVRLCKHLSKQHNLVLHKANTLAIEFLNNIRTIKQLSVEKEVLRQYSESIDQVSIASWRVVTVTILTYGILYGIEPCFSALLYWRTLILLEENELTLNNIIIVISFAMFATESTKIIGMLSGRIGQSLSAAESIFELFDRTPTINNASTEGQELVNFRGQIEFDQVKFIYPTRPMSTVLNKLQLTVKSGQRVGLVGTSGCGKSTIIQLMERFYDVTDGLMLLDGVDIRQLNLHWVRSRIGLVSQEPVLFDLTIAENIAYGLENIPIEEIIDAATKANIHQFIQQLPQGYETKVGVKGCFLSGGEKQRIAIARILLRRPKILLLDEATSALDVYNEQIVQEALERAQVEDPTRTSLIIAHRLSTVRSCDVICVLDNGHIVESGTHVELVEQHGIYHRMLAQHS